MTQASKIMIIRHAEKPTPAEAPYGVTIEGLQDEQSLTVLGWQRAGALAALFAPNHRILQHPQLQQPQYLFACAAPAPSDSKRPKETLTPLAQKLGININTSCTKTQGRQVATLAIGCKGVALIGWEHHNIPLVANAILGNNTTAPQKWPEERFDVIWIFDLDAKSSTYRFNQVPQQVLGGDLSTTL